MKPTVSIIVPAYNEEKYITKTLDSLQNQTYKDYEIIIVDNNSTDNTQKIAKKYVSNVFLEKKQGYHYAINRGIKEAKGTILTVCDADTVYPKNWLQKVVPLFKIPHVIAVYGPALYCDGNFLLKYIGGFIYVMIYHISHLLGVDITGGYNFLFTKKAYKQVGGYNPKGFSMYGLDIELGTRLKKIGKVKFSPSSIVYISTRRMQKDGYLKIANMCTKIWLNFFLKRPQTITYDEYMKGVRY